MSLILLWSLGIPASSLVGCVNVGIVSTSRAGMDLGCARRANRYTGKRARKCRQNTQTELLVVYLLRADKYRTLLSPAPAEALVRPGVGARPAGGRVAIETGSRPRAHGANRR